MTCQFAIRLGAFAGHNAAADLLGLPTEPYDQKTYVVCLDLGVFGRDFRAGMESAIGAGRSDGEGDQARDQHRLDLPAASERAKLFAAAPAQVMDLSVPAQAAAA